MSDALIFERYGNNPANTGVSRYAITPKAIHIQFHDHRVYIYSHQTPGQQHVERMKQLATEGKGLSTYISQHIQNRYERRYTRQDH